MKKPETPKTDASKKPTETISVDSKGTASTDPKKEDGKPGPSKTADEGKTTSSASSASTSATSGPTTTNKTATDKTATSTSTSKSTPGTSSAGTSTATGNKPFESAKKPTDAKPDSSPKGKSIGGKALLLFVVIIAGALAIGWLTRAIWWRDAEPVLSQYVPDSIMQEVAPDGFEGANNDPIVATNPPTDSQTPSTTNQNSDNTANEADNSGSEETATNVTDSSDLASDDMPSTVDGSDTEAVVIDPDLTERLSRLEGTIDALRERLNSESGDNLSNTVARRMAEIETRTAPIEELARVESELAGVANEMRELSARLSTMEAEVRATAGLRVESRGQAVAMAVSILRDALQRGGPFVIALNQLERSSGDNDAVISEQISNLKPLAEQGAPTIEQLRQSFPVMAQEAVQAATDDHSGSVLDATWANIKKLIPIRRVDAAGEESLEGRLVLAENALAENDLDAAVSALEGIEGEHASAAVQDWLSAAKRRQTLNASIETLSAHAIGLLTSTGESQ
ncbi:uroporphyrinogen III synthase [Thalassospira sp. MA62]|nr:uroporphyrinogen III synthase [Thalassospira sp. MA62]